MVLEYEEPRCLLLHQRNIRLPEEMLIDNVFCSLDKRDRIDGVSHVSKRLDEGLFSPRVKRWQIIEKIEEHGDDANMSDSDGVPAYYRMGSILTPLELTERLIEDVAKVCPNLEEFENYRDEPLLMSPEMIHTLPTLSRIEIGGIGNGQYKGCVMCIIEVMGERLVEIIVCVHCDMETGFTDDNFTNIARHCPNLRIFTYCSLRGFYDPYNDEHDQQRHRHSAMPQ